MPLSNPKLDEVVTRVGPPAIADYSQVLQGAGTLAEGIITNRKDNILEGFRNEVSTIVDTEMKPVRELTEQDQAFTGEFAQRMSRINRIATQGTTQGARTRALIAAETALRTAQRARPGLAAELRQEAALVLGTDPTGTALELAEQMNSAVQQSAQQDWADHVKFGYEKLGIPREIAPGSQAWYTEFTRLDKDYSANIQVTNALSFIKNIDSVTESNRANAQYWLANPQGVFRATVGPLNEAADKFALLTPDERLAWMGGQRTIDIGGNPVTYPQFKATLEAGLTELDASFGGLNEETRTQLSIPVSSLKTRIQQTLNDLGDPTKDPAIIASQFELETHGFLAGMTQDERYTLFATKEVAPYLTSILNASDFPQESIVEKNKIIKTITGLSGFLFVPPSQRISTLRDSLPPPPAGTSGEQGEQLSFQEYLLNIRELNKVLSTTSTPMPENVATSYVSNWIGALGHLSEIESPAPELVEQWLENFQDPMTLQVLQKADPYIGEEYAQSLLDFFNENDSHMSQVYTEIRNYGTTARYRGDVPIAATNVLVPVLRETGQVVLDFAPGIGLTDAQKIPLMAKKRLWEDALTRRVRAQATLDQLIDNTTDQPNFKGAFLKMAPRFPFTSFDASSIQ